MPLLLLDMVVGEVEQEEAEELEGHLDVADVELQRRLMTSCPMMIRIKGISCRRSPQDVPLVCTLVEPC